MKNLNLNAILFLTLALILFYSCNSDDEGSQDLFAPFIGPYENVEVTSTLIEIQEFNVVETHSTFTKDDDFRISRLGDSIKITSFWVSEDEAITLNDFFPLDVSTDVLRSGPFTLRENETEFYDLEIEGDVITLTRKYDYGFDGVSFSNTQILTATKI